MTQVLSGVWQNVDGHWCRKCPKCKSIVVSNCSDNIREKRFVLKSIGNLCRPCHLESQLKYLVKLKIDKRIKKVCMGCKKSFSVSNSKSERRYCSNKCYWKEVNNGNIKMGPVGMDKPTKDLWRKYSRYKKYDTSHGFKFEWELNEFRNEITKNNCYYCGRKDWLGFDRINNNDGHSKNNVLVCCELCNLTRGNRYSIEEFKVIGVAIKSLNITNRRIPKQTESNLFSLQKINDERRTTNK